MSIEVVVGGQFGGEGKGKTTAYLCHKYDFDAVVRCGGPNSGHTITFDDKQIVLRQIPAGVVNPNTKLFLAAGCIIDLEILVDEIKIFKLNPGRLGIDYNAVIVEDEFKKEEYELRKRIGSTSSGTGIAVSKRVLRDAKLRLVKDVPELKEYLVCTSEEILNYHINNKKVIIEGTQGMGLSVYHSPYYPFATSRDTTASAFLSEVGVSPLIVSDVIMVIRTFPIRVEGNSGPLPNEIDWDTIQKESGYPHKIQEFTSVTKTLRRVARFDLGIVKKAVSLNRPTKIALMGVDYFDYNNSNAKHYDELNETTKNFIYSLEQELGVAIKFIGTGPKDKEIIHR